MEDREFKMVSTSWMMPGVTCWVLSAADEKNGEENAYVRGIIISLTANRQTARMTYPEERGPDEVPVGAVYEANQDYESYKQGWDDMVSMNVLNEAEIIANVKLRYKQDIIFTYIGPTLIVMNPYKYIAPLFTQQVLEHYHTQLFANESFDMRDSSPHVYAISAQAYSQMFSSQKNQAIVISGESGAGKTENAKYAMKFLTSLSSKKESKGEVPIEDKILSCNPILEAFGNAKTVRNDNSSRFGKYVRIMILKDNRKIIGAQVANYLLEKSRVTQLSQGERNYHIFYHMMKGLSVQHLNTLQLCDNNGKPLPMSKFDYLNQSDCQEVDTIDDKALLAEVMTSFATMRFTDEEIDAIFRVVAGVLLLGNLKFDGSTLSDNDPCSIKNKDILVKISKTLMIEEDALANSILLKTREVVKQIMKSPNSLEECTSIAISLSRALYDKLFNWLVKKLNQTIIPAEGDEVKGQTLAIGLLDIFGFENFVVNSFEQLCINFTNEKLQQLYISYVFKSEEKEFIDQGLKDYLQQLKYNDNQPIIDLIDKYPQGIFSLLDESCSLAQATDDQLIQKIAKVHAEHPHFKVPKMIKDKFSIVHTPKEVAYVITGFRAKNKDEISKDLDRGICSSSNEEIVKFWQCLLTGEKFDEKQSQGSSKENKFLSAKFRKQMKELMDELLSCDVHFIRCIKSNEVKRKDYFINSYVLLQIRYLGILESVRVRKEGYPIRSEYGQFYVRYHELDQLNRRLQLKKHQEMGSDMKGLVREIVGRIFPKLEKKIVLYGNTKIYMKMEVGYKLDRKLQEWWKYKNEKALLIQKNWKTYKFRKNVKIGMQKIKKIYARIRRLQAYARMCVLRKRFLNRRKSVVMSKKLLVRFEMKTLKKSFYKFRTQAMQQPRKEVDHNKVAKVKVSKLLDILRRYHTRFNLYKFRIATEQADAQQLQPDQSQQFASVVNQPLLEDYLKAYNSKDNNQDIGYEELLLKYNEQLEEIQEQLHPPIDENIEDLPDCQMQTDFFEVNGLRIWSFEQFLVITPLLGSFVRQHASRKNNVEDTVNGSQKYKEVDLAWKNDLKYNNQKKKLNLQSVPLLEIGNTQMSSERLGPNDYDSDFMEQVKEANFFHYCDQNIYKGTNWKPNQKIQDMMKFNSQYLRQPILHIHMHFKSALTINRCMLKIAGVKNSRFRKEFLIDQILIILLGPTCVLPLPTPPEAYTSSDYAQKYAKLTFLKEKKIEQLLPSYRAFQSQEQTKKSKEDNVILYKQFLNLINNKTQVMIQEWQKDNQLQTGLLMLRDEAYLQLCRLLNDNINRDHVQNLYRFACVMSYLVGPTKKTIFAILNFFLDRMENESEENNRNYARILFNNLARQAIQLNVLAHMDEIHELCPKPSKPNQWGKSYSHVSELIPISLIKKLKLYRRDPITERLARIVTGLDSTYEMFLSAFSITNGRLILPSLSEVFYIQQRKQLLLRLSICNEAVIWVPVDAMNTIREARGALILYLGLEKLQQYYGLYQTVEIDGKERESFWCPDSCKVLDLGAKEINDMEVYDQHYMAKIVIKLYLKVKVFYPLMKNDLISLELYYHQFTQQVLKGEIPVGVEKAITLGALNLFIAVKSSATEVWPTQDQVCENINSFLPETLVNGAWQNARFKQHNDRQPTFTVQDWGRKLLRAASKLEFDQVSEAKWLYINILRTFDLFMAQQIKCSYNVVVKGTFGVLRRKKFVPGFLGVRPSHLVLVDWPSRNTFRILAFEDILQWGRAVGTDVLIFIRQKNLETIFLQMSEDGMETLDYLMNAYLNWEQCKPLDSHLVPPPKVQERTFNLNLYSTVKEGDQSYDFGSDQYFSQYNQYDLETGSVAMEEFDYGQFAGGDGDNGGQYEYDF